MINQVLLKGVVVEIYEESMDIKVEGLESPVHICDVFNISYILLNNIVAIKGHLEISNNGILFVACDNCIILDGRGIKND